MTRAIAIIIAVLATWPATAADTFDQRDLAKTWVITGMGNGPGEYAGEVAFCSFVCTITVNRNGAVKGKRCELFINGAPGVKLDVVKGTATPRDPGSKLYAWWDLNLELENGVTFRSRGRHQFVYDQRTNKSKSGKAIGPFTQWTGLWTNSLGMSGMWNGQLSRP